MVSLISIGIEKYGKNSLNDIPCAYRDAQMVYDVFEKVLRINMKKHSSACLKDLNVIEFKALLSALQMTMDADDIFILYFSGHGLVGSNGRLKIVFSDYMCSEEKGTVAISEIESILSNYNCNIVLILDCCYSGASLADVGKDDIKLEKSVSILASNSPIGKAGFTEEGSMFTSHLCKAIETLYELQQDISLDSIYNMVKDDCPNCQIVTGGGSPDIIFSVSEKKEIPEDFCEKFINKISLSNYEVREALWYALGYFPEPFRLEVLEQYKKNNDNIIGEMSWRVRRAIGSICRYNSTSEGEKWVKKLIESSNWMDKCIGFISLHKTTDKDITNAMLKELQDIEQPMDLAWLLSLYLSERECDVKETVLKTNLLKTTWGAIEIWKRYYEDMPLEHCRGIFEKNMDKENFKAFCLELYLRGKNDAIELEEYSAEIQQHINSYKELYSGTARGRFEASKINKWIFSVLYGSWRDQMDISKILEAKLKTLRKNKKISFLKSLKNLPSVELKMAIVDFFVTKMKEKQYNELIENLKWALEDEHPWVIRTALPLFKGNDELIENICAKTIDINIYPGVFDLAIELKKQGFKDCIYEISNMMSIEEEQLRRARENE